MNPYMYIKIGPRIPIFWTVHGSIYADPYMRIGQWIPILRSVRGSLHSGRSIDPYIFNRSMDPFIQNGPLILIFKSVRGSLYSWIPICRSVHEFLYADRSVVPYPLAGLRIPIFSAVRGSLINHNFYYMAILQVKIIWLSIATITTILFRGFHLYLDRLNQYIQWLIGGSIWNLSEKRNGKKPTRFRRKNVFSEWL